MSTNRTNARRIGLGNILVLIPASIVSIIVLTFGFYEARKAYWDYQVDKLCAIDGGIKINEVMYVDAQEYEKLKSKFGNLAPPLKGSPESVGAVAFHSDLTTYIKRNDPTVAKYVLSITRAADGVVLATRTSYWRSDGDLISFHPSSYSCRPGLANFFESVINRQEKIK